MFDITSSSFQKSKPARYVVGIDLGTTNIAVSYIDTRRHPMGGGHAIELFFVPQLVSEAEVRPQDGLPSFLYLSTGTDLPAGSLDLPWEKGAKYAVGEFARRQGARVPGGLIASAKSWLCHPGVDRRGAILPWGESDCAGKTSPVEVSARYLRHIRDAWNHALSQKEPDSYLDSRFEEQDIVLTVPASFDEVARELTVEAASNAGLSRVTLLEEPQAAFYSWIAQHEKSWDQMVRPGMSALVCDIGGGTTDFTLFSVKEGDAAPVAERVAVGDHLLLGGDNMDCAIARLVETRMLGESGGQLDSTRWHMLVSLCRDAKEALLDGSKDQDVVSITLPGRGKGVVGGSISALLSARDVAQAVLEGFFPTTQFDVQSEVTDSARSSARPFSGIQEWGLPFASDPIIPNHMAAFLRAHCKGKSAGVSLYAPDAILFNGGVFMSKKIRARILQILSEWFSSGSAGHWTPVILDNDQPAHAVAAGAAYYGMVKRGRGVRIVGGSPRSYYVKVAHSDVTTIPSQNEIKGVCVIPRGMQEGEEVEIESPVFYMVTNQPVIFSLFSSTTRSGDQLGQVLSLDINSIQSLPPLKTLLRFGKKGEAKKIPVVLCTRLTEIGTLEVECHAKETEHRWQLQFNIRPRIEYETDGHASDGGCDSIRPEDGSPKIREDGAVKRSPACVELTEDALTRALDVLRIGFGATESDSESDSVNPATIMKALRCALHVDNHVTNHRDKQNWPMAVLRRLSDSLLAMSDLRAKSARHEERWLNLAGFCLRPGYNYIGDDFRMRNLWKLYKGGLTFDKDPQCRVEWWTLWRRVAGGLTQSQQAAIAKDLSSILWANNPARGEKQKRIGAPERTEAWRLMANLERLPVSEKTNIGNRLADNLGSTRGEGLNMWVLARLGARIPFYGPLNCVVPAKVAEEWIRRILKTQWKKSEQTAFCIVQMACYTADRERDIPSELRDEIKNRLEGVEGGDRLMQRLSQIVSLSLEERDRIFGENLPEGLHLEQ